MNFHSLDIVVFVIGSAYLAKASLVSKEECAERQDQQYFTAETTVRTEYEVV